MLKRISLTWAPPLGHHGLKYFHLPWLRLIDIVAKKAPLLYNHKDTEPVNYILHRICIRQVDFRLKVNVFMHSYPKENVHDNWMMKSSPVKGVV